MQSISVLQPYASCSDVQKSQSLTHCHTELWLLNCDWTIAAPRWSLANCQCRFSMEAQLRSSTPNPNSPSMSHSEMAITQNKHWALCCSQPLQVCSTINTVSAECWQREAGLDLNAVIRTISLVLAGAQLQQNFAFSPFQPFSVSFLWEERLDSSVKELFSLLIFLDRYNSN